MARRGLLVRHVLKRGAKGLLHEDLACSRRTPLRQIERGVRREHPILGFMLGDDLRHQRVDREAIASKTDGRMRDVAEAHRAEALKGRNPGVGRRRHHGAQDALRNFAAVVLLEVVALDRHRPGAETRDREDAIVGGGIDDDRGDARDVDIFGLHDTQRDARRDTGVDRIAARLQNPKAGLGRKVLGGGHHVARAHDRGAMGFHVSSAGQPVGWRRRASLASKEYAGLRIPPSAIFAFLLTLARRSQAPR